MAHRCPARSCASHMLSANGERRVTYSAVPLVVRSQSQGATLLNRQGFSSPNRITSHPAGLRGVQAVRQQLEPFIFEWVSAAAGSISAEHGIGAHKRGVVHYSQPPVALDLMRKIKAVLDPRATLNPGKILHRTELN